MKLRELIARLAELQHALADREYVFFQEMILRARRGQRFTDAEVEAIRSIVRRYGRFNSAPGEPPRLAPEGDSKSQPAPIAVTVEKRGDCTLYTLPYAKPRRRSQWCRV